MNELFLSLFFFKFFNKAQRRKIAHKWRQGAVSFVKLAKTRERETRFLGKLCFLFNESILSKWDTGIRVGDFPFKVKRQFVTILFHFSFRFFLNFLREIKKLI